MAVYKVPQDVEAEDKLLGPFSFKQFVFLMIAVAALALAFALSSLAATGADSCASGAVFWRNRAAASQRSADRGVFGGGYFIFDQAKSANLES